MAETLTGGCCGGDLRCELRSTLGLVANCHGGFCRRIHGAPYTTVAFIKADAFQWTFPSPSKIRELARSHRDAWLTGVVTEAGD